MKYWFFESGKETNVAENNEFRTAKRGFEPEDVDRAFAQITNRIASAREQREAAEKDIERLSRELNEARIAVKRANSKPTFSDLGAAFEQTLRVAEEQAGKLLQDASEEVATVRDAAKADADRIQVSSERQATKLISEAEKRAEKITDDSEKRSVALVSDAEAQLVAANTAVAQASMVIEGVERVALSDANVILENAKLELEQARREMTTLRELQARDQLRIEREIIATHEKAQREGDRLASETSAFTVEILAEAQLQVAESQRKAEQLISEAENLSAKAHADAETLMRTSAATASGIISRAQARSTALNAQTAENKAKVEAETAMTLATIEDERVRVLGFTAELRAMGVDDDNVEPDWMIQE